MLLLAFSLFLSLENASVWYNLLCSLLYGEVLSMDDWTLFKNSIQNISKDEIKLIDTLSYLQAERIRRGISQTELAKKIGIKQSQLAKIEQLDSTPILATLNRYAKGLGLAIQIKVIAYAEA